MLDRMSHALLLTFYGDDFSGSTDALEALSLAGVKTVLFLKPPTAEQVARHPDLRAVGVAGLSRTMSPGQMDAELPAAFHALRRLGAPLVHYKVCSTFDSAPEIGSIGRAIDCGQAVFASRFVPLVVGAPALGRYCVFGNLFARSGGDSPVYRLDRHPTMSRHPTTPMNESDLRVHLSRQTNRRIALVDVLQLSTSSEAVEAELRRLMETRDEIVLFDVLTDEHMQRIGRVLWSQAGLRPPLFAVGSSGIEHALAAHWRAAGILPSTESVVSARPVEQLIVVSGSCSPVTERQIGAALAEGFVDLPLAPDRWSAGRPSDAELRVIVEQTVRLLSTGRSVIVHTSRGPADPRIAAARQLWQAAAEDESSAVLLGTTLGRILRAVLEVTGLRRAVVTGGDTASYVARELGIESLEFVAPIAPGAPLCRIQTACALPLDGTEIIFKGGQLGQVDFFQRVRIPGA